MAGEALRCPLCGTVLPRAKYERLLKKHEGLKAHVQHLRDQAQRLKAEAQQLNEEKKGLRKQYVDFRKKERVRVGEALRAQGQKVEGIQATAEPRELPLTSPRLLPYPAMPDLERLEWHDARR
jgi:DNA repair exonuclease SbcCD ATPase subunit